MFQLSFRVRTRGVKDQSRGFVWLNVLNADTTKLLETGFGHFAGDTDWKTESYTFLAPVATRAVRIGGTLTGRGTIWFDDFTLREVPLREDSMQLSTKAEDYIAAVLDTLETYAVNRAELDFGYIRQSIRYAARGSETPADTYGAIRQGVSMLRDRGHSQLFTRDELEEMLGGMDIQEMLDLEKEAGSPYLTTPPLDRDSLRAELTFGIGKLLAGEVGYVSVPAFTHGHLTAVTLYADSLQRLIRELDQSNDLRGWIVDLRGNYGGANAPMIVGVGPLLRPESRVHYIKASGTVESSLTYRDGANYILFPQDSTEQLQLQSAVDYTVRDTTLPIAVLVDRNTGSAGEVVAALFRGEAGVQLFGQATGGYTTGNDVFPLPDLAALNLATGYLASRQGEVYRGPIAPDVEVGGAAGAKGDGVLAAAVEWINAR